MPLVTVSCRAGKAPAFGAAVLDGVHRALVASGVPEKDRFHRLLELDEAHFRYDPDYPDARKPRTRDFVLVEIVLSVGRSVKVKRKILADLVANLGKAPGLDPEDVMVVFVETTWENWAFAGGRQIHVG